MFLNPYTAGNPIGGQTGFFGRDDILRDVLQVLRHPQSNAIVLYGQRRIGKTSMLLQLERQLVDLADYLPVYFDLQDKADKPLEDVLYELAQRISAVTRQVTPNRDLFDSEGAYFRDEFVPQATEMVSNGGLVLLFDEFDVLDSPKENQAGAAFFPYLRQWMGDAKGVQFVFVIGRRPEDLSINTISTFKGVRATRVSLLEPDNAAAVVRQSQEEGSLLWSDEAVEKVWQWAQGHPYFTQLLCSVIWENAHEEEPDEVPIVTPNNVDNAVNEVLKQGANAFVWIWDGLPPAERVVISAMAEAKERVITHDDLVDILNKSGVRLIVRQLELAPETLVEWELLQPVNGSYQFTVLLLRQWVQKNRPLRRTKEELDLLDPQAESLFQTGQRFYNAKQLEYAESQLRLALQSNPNHLKAQLLLGQLLFEQTRLDETITVLENAYKYDPGAARAELIKALLALANSQEESEQLVTYQQILDIDPNQPIAIDSILSIRIKEAAQLEAEEKWTNAIRIYDELLQQFPKGGQVSKLLQAAHIAQRRQRLISVNKAAMELEQEENWQELIHLYHNLLDEFPDEEDWHSSIEKAEVELNLQQKYSEALVALKASDLEIAQRYLADVIYEYPDYKDAASYFLEATSGFNITQLLQKLKDSDHIISSLQEDNQQLSALLEETESVALLPFRSQLLQTVNLPMIRLLRVIRLQQWNRVKEINPTANQGLVSIL